MSWRDLLQTEQETLVVPWVGGRSLRVGPRAWKVLGPLPREHGWAKFRLQGRKAFYDSPADPTPLNAIEHVKGYIVGDRIIRDGVASRATVDALMSVSERVYLVDPGLGRFVRISASRFYEDGPLIYRGLEFPLGPESEVLAAYQDQMESTSHIPGVSPALDVAFRLESWRRSEAERRRREEAERLRLEQERLEREERRRQLVERLGDAQGRRAMAATDFAEAARAALAVGGAEYLDHRNSYNRDEMVVQFRLNGRRFECTCHPMTLRIIDSGICLTSHDTGEKGDTYFTLESLPSVISEAERDDVLVVYRHVD